jgi:hypothetical protein
VSIFGTFVNFKIDSGADTSAICDATYKTLRNPPKLQTANTVHLVQVAS